MIYAIILGFALERKKIVISLKGEVDMLKKEEGERQSSMVDLCHERDKHATSLKDYQQKMKYSDILMDKMTS